MDEDGLQRFSSLFLALGIAQSNKDFHAPERKVHLFALQQLVLEKNMNQVGSFRPANEIFIGKRIWG